MYTYTIYIYTQNMGGRNPQNSERCIRLCVCVSMQCCKCSFLTSFPWMCPNMQPDWIC